MHRYLKETTEAEKSEATGTSVVWSFAIIVFGAIGTIIAYGIAFIVLRKRDRRYFTPWRPDFGQGSFLELVKKVYVLSDGEMKEAGGTEGLLFVLRGRLNAAICVRCVLVAILATGLYASTPIDASCVKTLTKQGCRRPGFERLSLPNVPDRNWRLWMVPIASFYLAYSCLHLIKKYDHIAAKLAYRAALSEAPQHFRAVVLTDLPPSMQVSEKKIRDFFRKLGLRGVRHITMLRDLDHPEFYIEREFEVSRRETRSSGQMALQFQEKSKKVFKSGLHQVSRATELLSQDLVGQNLLAHGKPGPRRLLADYEYALAGLARAEILYKKALGLKRKDDISKHMSSMVKGVTGIDMDERASLMKARQSAEEKRLAVLAYLKDRDAPGEEEEDIVFKPSRAAIVVFSKVSEAVLAAAAPLVVAEESILKTEAKRNSILSLPSGSDYEDTGPLRRRPLQQVSVESQETVDSNNNTNEKKDDIHLKICAAPEMKEIDFQALEGLEPAEKRHRSEDQGQTAKVLLNIYFMTALTLTQAAAGRFIQRFANDSPRLYGDADLVGIVGNALPALIQIYFLDIAVAFFKRIALRFDGRWSKSSIEKRLYHDFAPFLILNFFVSNLVGGSLINSLFVITKNPSLFLKQLGIGAIDQAPYFGQVAFLRLVQLLTRSGSGARVYDFFTAKLLLQRCVTQPEVEAIYTPEYNAIAVPASWADLFVLMSLIFAPFGACPTSISCLIFVLADLLFAKYKVSAVYRPSFENFGAKLWPVYIDHCLRAVRLALFLALLIMALICDKDPKQHTFYVALALLFVNFYARDRVIAIHRAREESFFALLNRSDCALPLLAATKLDDRTDKSWQCHDDYWSPPHALLNTSSFVTSVLEQKIPSPDSLPALQRHSDLELQYNNDQEIELALHLQAEVAHWLKRHASLRLDDMNSFSPTSPTTTQTDDDDIFYDAEEATSLHLQAEGASSTHNAFSEEEEEEDDDDASNSSNNLSDKDIILIQSASSSSATKKNASVRFDHPQSEYCGL